jgi:8-oxo-dGTP pyrophosphatase MutT (NUDIX family)
MAHFGNILKKERLSCARRALEPVVRRFFHLYWRFSRGMTLGVRALVLDADGRVFLVKHSYVSGWHLPGGGVEPGETALEALGRELLEEGNIALTDAPLFHGLYFNRRVSDRDHVILFVVKKFRQSSPPKPDHEIIAHGFFAPDALPEDTTAATRARIAEALRGASVPDRW